MIGAIDVRDLVGRYGTWKAEQVSGTIDDLATELAGLSEDTPISGELVLESLAEGHPRERPAPGGPVAAVRPLPEGVRAGVLGRAPRALRPVPARGFG